MEYTEQVPDKKLSDGFLNFNFGKLDDAVRKISFNKPWVKALLLGVPSYFIGKSLTPKLVGLLSPTINKATGIDFGSYNYMTESDQNRIKRIVGSLSAIAAMTPTIVHNIDFTGNKKYFGLNDFSPKQLHKNANFDPFNPMHAIPLSTARHSIMTNPALTPMTKATSCAILDSFPQNTQITGKDVVDQAVSTGISGALKFAAGAVAAHAIGLPNPYTTAAIVTGLSSI